MTIPKSFLSALTTLVSVRRLERYFAEAEYTGLTNNAVTSSEANLEALAGVYTYPAVEDDKEDAIRKPFELHLPHIVLPSTGLVLITGPSGSMLSLAWLDPGLKVRQAGNQLCLLHF